jgi:hypothetical protein
VKFDIRFCFHIFNAILFLITYTLPTDESKPFGGILARRKMIQESRQDSMYSGYDSEDWE